MHEVDCEMDHRIASQSGLATTNWPADTLIAGVDDVAAALASLDEHDAVSLPVLSEAFRRALLVEARAMDYRPARQTIGEGDRVVRQEMALSTDFAPAGLFHRLRRDFEDLVVLAAARLARQPFTVPLRFDDMIVQRYRVGALGITPHRDHLSYINLGCLFTIAGEARFCLCADRTGHDAREIDAAPGRVIFLRAPELYGKKNRPFHFVGRIRAERYSLGLRQLCVGQTI